MNAVAIDPGTQAGRIKLTTLFSVSETDAYTPSKHSALVMIYCCKGSAIVNIECDSYSLTAGWLILSRIGKKHMVMLRDTRSQCYILESCYASDGIDPKSTLDAASYSPFALLFTSFDLFIRFDTEENRILLTLNELGNEFSRNKTSNKRLLELLFEVFLIKLARAVQVHGRASGSSYVAEAKKYIRDNLANNITVQSVAEHIGIHRSYLMRVFRQQTQKTVNQYINRMRATQATVLLTNSDISITEIAFHVGFNSRQNFYLVFEKYIGSLPSEYRASYYAKVSEGE